MRLILTVTTTLAILSVVLANSDDSDEGDINREITLLKVEEDGQGMDTSENSSQRKIRQFGFPGFGGGFGRPGFGGGPGLRGPGFRRPGFGGPGFGRPGFGGPRFGGGSVVRERVRVTQRVRVRQRFNNGFGGGFYG